MKCPNCKNKIESGQKFCNYCGAPIPPKNQKKVNKQVILPVGVACVCGAVVLCYNSAHKSSGNFRWQTGKKDRSRKPLPAAG